MSPTGGPADDSEPPEDATPRLAVVIASTRPSRSGLPIAEWFVQRATLHGGFDLEVVDLEELALPELDEPNHPRLGRYTKEHTLAWSRTVQRCDGFVFVMPEYNYGYPAALKNAIDYLHQEWKYKPVGFVSYGGVAAGTRAVQQLKQVVTALKMVPILEAVHIPFHLDRIDQDGRFRPTQPTEDAVGPMLEELLRVAPALRTLRGPR